jgi:hypothetical protein
MDTTGRYTCPVAGVYQAAGQIRLTGVAANQVVGVGIYKNGIKAAEGGAATAGQAGDEAVTVADLLNCNAGDYIELYIYCSAADNVVLSAADNYLAVAEITGTGLPGPQGPPGSGGGGAPTGPAGGDLTGSTYPNPIIAALAVTTAKIAAAAVDLATKVTGVLPLANGGTGQTTAKAARELGLLSGGYYSNGALHGAGTTITITQATHGLRSSPGIYVQCQDNATGNVEIPDVSVDGAGNVTITYAAAVAANSKLVVLIG